MNSKEFERNEPNRRSIRLKPNKLEVVTLGELPTAAKRTTILSSPQPVRVTAKNLRNEQTSCGQIEIRDGYSLKLSDITGLPPKPAHSSPIEAEDQSLSVLQNLERQIHTMEFDTRMNAERSDRSADVLDSKKDRPVHYGELPSLLNTGISDVAGNGFGYMDKAGDSDSDEHLGPSSFKRGEDSRSSTSGAFASSASRKVKATRVINRTASDSKNAETTAKLLRQKKPAPRPPMIIPTTSPPQVTKLVPKEPVTMATAVGGSSGSSSAGSSSTAGSSSIGVAAARASPISSVKNSTERKISSEIMKHLVNPQKSQVMC